MPIVSITDFGAVADSIGADSDTPTPGTDNSAGINAALLAVRDAGGGTAIVPTYADPDRFYGTTHPIIMQPGVSLVGEGGYPMIRNTHTNSIDDQRARLMLLGNLHPAFVQDAGLPNYNSDGGQWPGATFYALEPFGYGAWSVTLSRSADSANFKIGQQVMVASRVKGVTSGFQISIFAIFTTVVDIAGAVVKFADPIDIEDTGFGCEICILGNEKWRHESWYPADVLFFWSGRLAGLRLRADHIYDDSSAKNFLIEDNVSKARKSLIYGNAFQNGRFIGNRCEYSQKGAELSMNSYRVAGRFNTVTAWDEAGQGPDTRGNFAFGSEYARWLDFDRTNFFRGCAPAQGACLLLNRGGQNCLINPMIEFSDLGDSPVCGFDAHDACADFPITGNRLGAGGEGAGAARAALLAGLGADGNPNPDFYDNRIDGYEVTCPYTALGAALLFQNLGGSLNGISNSIISMGAIEKDNCAEPIRVWDSYVDKGYATVAAAIGDDIRNLRDGQSYARSTFNTPLLVADTAPDNATTLIFNRSIGKVGLGDRIDLDIIVKGTALLGRETVRVALWDDTSGNEVAASVLTVTQGTWKLGTLAGRLAYSCYAPDDSGGPPSFVVDGRWNASGTISGVKSTRFALAAGDDYSLRVSVTSASTGNKIKVYRLHARISNPFCNDGTG